MMRDKQVQILVAICCAVRFGSVRQQSRLSAVEHLPVNVTLDISGSPIDLQSGFRKYPG